MQQTAKLTDNELLLPPVIMKANRLSCDSEWISFAVLISRREMKAVLF